MPRRPTLLALLLLAAPAAAGEPFKPDPAGVRRYGPAYRYPQAGWIVLHIEGEPFDRGYQHGRLLAAEIAGYVDALARQQSVKAPADGWKLTRTLVGAAFLRKFDREYLDEMHGIADGAAAAGATFDGRPIDLLDIAAANVAMEYETLDAALEAQPTGLEGVRFPRPPAPKCCPPAQKDHCSAFIATGRATKDGKLVVGHITMSGLYNALYTNVWLDVQPAKGHRVVMQANPGGIWSAQDYYLNSAGIVLTETTIRQTQYDPAGEPLAGRARKAVQYGSTIDDVVKHLTEKNNGLYANEWLIGDANTNEIAVLELGTKAHRLRRSSKNEWMLPGVEGFYWGCNNTKDMSVRLETIPGLTERPQNMAWRPSDRDKAWLGLYREHRGRIDADFGKLAFRTPPLSARPSLDAKVTTADMAKRLESHAVFGPPYQKIWTPTFEEKTNYPAIKALVPNDWVVLTAGTLPANGTSAAADIVDRIADPPGYDANPPTRPAWHGTLLPKTDADLWLTAGFAEYERVIALENALWERGDGQISHADNERVNLTLFRYRSDYLSAKANRPAWRDGGAAPDAITAEFDRDRWHKEQVALGVLALHAWREKVGHEKFAAAMEAVGKALGGKEATAAGFADAAGAGSFLADWAKAPKVGGPTFDVADWLGDLEHTVIVYGTREDAAANAAAARSLAEAVRVRWTNIAVPVLADTASDETLKGKHVVVIGRPAANTLAAKWAKAFPAAFGPQSVRVGGSVYAHEDSAVALAGTSPADAKFSAVLLAGLSADATYRLASRFVADASPAEALISVRGGPVVPKVVTPAVK